MHGSIGLRLAVLACTATFGVMASANAGNRLQAIQTTGAPCSPNGGGGAIAISPDGAHVYEATSRVFVSSRSAATGGLTLVQTVELPDPYWAVNHMTVSPDGRNLYVSRGTGNPGIAVFARDTGSGALTLVDSEDFVSPFQVAVSPDGKHVYAAGGFDLGVFAREPTTGALSPVELYSSVFPTGEDVLVSPDGAHVYWSRDSALGTYSRDPGTGALTLVGTIPFPGRLAMSPDGENVYVLGAPSIRTFHRDAGTGLLTQIDVETSSDPGLASLFWARDLAVGPGGGQVYVVVDFFVGRVLVFDRDSGDGSLTFKEEHIDQSDGVDGLGDPVDLAVPADGAHVYTIGAGGTVTFERDGLTGSLTFLREAAPEQAEDLVASPDGRHVYRLCSRRITTFGRDATSGLLTHSGTTDVGQNVDDAYAMEMSPDGEHLYVFSLGPSLVSVFHRDAVTGALASLTEYPGSTLGDPAAPFRFSPDGEHVYARHLVPLLSDDRGLLILTRDLSTGLLAPVGSIHSGEGGIPAGALFNVTDIVVSPDGENVYASSYASYLQDVPRGGITAFTRDPGTGALTFADMPLRTDGSGRDTFDGVDGLAISTDGTFVYANGGRSICPNGCTDYIGAVAAYARDAAGGDLTRRSQLLREGTANAGTFDEMFGVAVHPDGTMLYGTAFDFNNGWLQVVRTDPTTGSFAFVERIPGPWAGVVRPYGDRVYALQTDGNVAVLGPRPICAAAPATGCSGADASTLRVSAKNGPSDTVVWKWTTSGTISVGDPLTTTEYAFCVYDSSALAQPVFSSAILPGRTCGTKPCWAAAATGYKYTDRAGIPDGINSIRVLGGTSGTARIALKGKGVALPEPGLPYQTPVAAQLQASNGQCWEASYTAATSSSGRFTATQ